MLSALHFKVLASICIGVPTIVFFFKNFNSGCYVFIIIFCVFRYGEQKDSEGAHGFAKGSSVIRRHTNICTLARARHLHKKAQTVVRHQAHRDRRWLKTSSSPRCYALQTKNTPLRSGSQASTSSPRHGDGRIVTISSTSARRKYLHGYASPHWEKWIEPVSNVSGRQGKKKKNFWCK